MIKTTIVRHFDPERALIMCLPLSAMSNLFQNLPGFSLVNQVFVLIYSGLLLFRLTSEKLNRSAYVELMVALVLTSFSFAMTSWPFDKVGTIPYFVLSLLSLLVFAQNPEKLLVEIAESRKYFCALLVLWCLIVVVSIPMGSSWQISDTGQRYFVSITGSSFQLMPTALMMASLAGCLLRISFSKPVLLSLAVPFYVAFSSGSRTYFALIALVLFVTLEHCVSRKKTRVIIALFLIIVGLVAYAQSGVSEKFDYVTGQGVEYSGSFINSITSGRWDMWAYEVSAFGSSSFLHQLFGNGFDYIYQVNQEAVGVELWAHNDFLNILLTHGLVGLVVYISVCLTAVLALSKRLKLTKPMMATLLFIWLFNAFFNMFYTYMCAFLSVPFIAICLSEPKITKADLYGEKVVS